MKAGSPTVVNLALALCATSLAAGGEVRRQSAEPTFDVLVRGGRVLDGTGNPDFRADVGIREDRIALVGNLAGATAELTIDASGLFVAPGFIDLHSHADRALASDFIEARQAYSLNHQGLTTIVAAADGRNVDWPLSEEAAHYERPGVAMNVALMVGHGTVREEVMGEDYEHEATPEEIRRMKDLVRLGMEEGAWGLFAGLEYRPGRFSSPEEVIELAGVVAEYDGFYIAHQRSEAVAPMWYLPSMEAPTPLDRLAALEETIEIARRTGIPVVASHQKAWGRRSYGRSAQDLIVVERARAEGLQVYLDVYPYETSGVTSVLPNWALADPGVDASRGNDSPAFREPGALANARENLKSRWSDPQAGLLLARDIEWMVDLQGGPERVLIVDHPDRSIVGKTLSELASEWRATVSEVVIRLQQSGYPDLPAGVRLRGHGMHEMDIEAFLRQDYTAMASDGAVSGVPRAPGFEGGAGAHPRHFGAFVRKLARYVKDRQVITLAFAIRSATSLPAQIIGLKDRGQIRPGFHADVVVFDWGRLRDRATPLEPSLPSEGVEYVMVNGKLTIDRGRSTAALPGRVLRKRRGGSESSTKR
jgi:N-acyl-D-amino-acid deacylase